jgi:hypothetical protein
MRVGDDVDRSVAHQTARVEGTAVVGTGVVACGEESPRRAVLVSRAGAATLLHAANPTAVGRIPLAVRVVPLYALPQYLDLGVEDVWTPCGVIGVWLGEDGDDTPQQEEQS